MIRIVACFCLAALLAACQSPVRPAVPADQPVPQALRTPGPVDLMLPASGAITLPTRLWTATAPQRGVMLALHGFADSRDGWELSAPAFAAAGFTVYAPDQRGFGAAPGRGTWPGTDTLLADARALVAAIAAREPGQPLYVIGESMGGAEAQLLAADPPAGVRAFIALAPAVWTSRQMGPGLTVPLALANALAPGWQPDPHRFGVQRKVTDNCAALLRLSYDPLTLHGTSIAELHGIVQLMDRAAAEAPRVRAPLLVAYGAHDTLIPPEAMAANWAALPGWVRRAYYPSGYHLLPDDLGRRSVSDDVIAWITDAGAALPSGADIAASTFPVQTAADGASPPLWAGLDTLPGADRPAAPARCHL